MLQEYKNIHVSQEKVARNRNLFNWKSNFDGYLHKAKEVFSDFTPAEIAEMDLLFWLAFTVEKIYPTQKWIAQKTKYSDRTFRRFLEKAKPRGLINPQRRYNTSCIYRLNSKLFNLQILEELRFIFPTVNTYLFKIEQQNVRLSSLLSSYSYNKLASYSYIYDHQKEHSCLASFLKKDKIAAETKRAAASCSNNSLNERVFMSESILLLLKSLALTEEQIKSLSRFSDAALAHAIGRLRSTASVGSPGGFLFKVAKDFEEEKVNKKPNFSSKISIDFEDGHDSEDPQIQGNKYSNERVTNHEYHPNCTCKLIWTWDAEGKPKVVAVPKNSVDPKIKPRTESEQQPHKETDQIRYALQIEIERTKRDLAEGAYLTPQHEAVARQKINDLTEQLKYKTYAQREATASLESPWELQEKYKTWVELPQTEYIKENNPAMYESLHNLILRSIEISRRKWNEAHPRKDNQADIFVKD